jgi:hypothetical protein
MKTSIIEQYDRMRYNIIKGFTVAFMLWYGFYICFSNFQFENRMVKIISIILILITWIIWTIYLVKLIKFGKKLKHDGEVNNAINNELIQHYKLKSSFVGLISAIVATGIIIGIASFKNIPGKLVCEILLYVTISSSAIAFLIYNKN